MITNPLPMHPGKVLAKVYMSQMVHKTQPRDAWVRPGVHDDRIRCSRSPEYALDTCELLKIVSFVIHR